MPTLALALAPGCAATVSATANRQSAKRTVTLKVEGGETFTYTPESGGQPVHVPEAELWPAFAEAGRHVVAQADPLSAAQQTFGLTEQSGTYRYYVRSRRLVAESLGGGLLEDAIAAQQVTRGYREWCLTTAFGDSDCLRLLVHSPVLSPHGRYVVTLVMAMVRSVGPMLDSLEGLANPGVVAVTLASAAAVYLTLLLIPEPISKVIAVGLTVALIGYLGLDLFFSIVDGWAALTEAADRAEDFGDLRLAARNFGEVLGPRMGQVLLFLVSRSLGKGLTAQGPTPPGFPQASAQANGLLGLSLGETAAVRAVALGAGGITISVATPTLVLAKATGGDRGGGGGGDGSGGRKSGRVRSVTPAKWTPPEGGPGKWQMANEAMSDEARAYQSQITGAPPGWVYKIDDVSFDGYINGVLLDAKDRYAQFFTKGPPGGPQGWFRGFGAMRELAQRQISAARGARIQWHFAEKDVADYVRRAFAGTPELKPIEVVYTPRAP